MPFSYFGLLLFAFPFLAALLIDASRHNFGVNRSYRTGIGLHVVLALGYTLPWDNYTIVRGMWKYSEGRVPYTLPHAPVEEYVFIVIQAVTTGLWVHRFDPLVSITGISWRHRILDAIGGAAVGVVGISLLAGS